MMIKLLFLASLGSAVQLKKSSSPSIDFVMDVKKLEKVFNISHSGINFARAQREIEAKGSEETCWQKNVVRHPSKDLAAIQAPKIAIATLLLGYPREVVDIVRRNHQRYADAHGYEYRFMTSGDIESYDLYMKGRPRKPAWSKLGFIRQLMTQAAEQPWFTHKEGEIQNEEPDYRPDYVFWMDGDSLFINNSIPLEDLANLNKDIVIAGDNNGLNVGHMMLKNSDWTIKFLDKAFAICPPPAGTYDQAGITALFGGADENNRSTWSSMYQRLNKMPLETIQDAARMTKILSHKVKSNVVILPQCTMNTYGTEGDVTLNSFIWHIGGSKDKIKTMKTVGNSLDQLSAVQDLWRRDQAKAAKAAEIQRNAKSIESQRNAKSIESTVGFARKKGDVLEGIELQQC